MRLSVIAVLLVLLWWAVARADAPPYVVVVHPSNPVGVIDRKTLAEMFLKKTTNWPDNLRIRPVDLDPNSPVRRRFSEAVLGRSPEAVRSYWQQVLFAGREVPPPEVDSDEDVIKYVLKYPGAIGYVSTTANVKGLKTPAVR